VSYYDLDGVQPSRRLVPEEYQGAGRLSRTTLCEGDKNRGDQAFQALDDRKIRIWHEGDAGDPPRGWTPAKPYRSFVAVPIATVDNIYGMITLDSADPAAFKEKDLEAVQLFADAFVTVVAFSRQD
jgi:transcriptional regulator with GAF, ATPase, and Fis domain